MSAEFGKRSRAHTVERSIPVTRGDGISVEGSISRTGMEIELFSIELVEPTGGLTIAMYEPSEVQKLGHGDFRAGTKRILKTYLDSTQPPIELLWMGKLLGERTPKQKGKDKGKKSGRF